MILRYRGTITYSIKVTINAERNNLQANKMKGYHKAIIFSFLCVGHTILWQASLC